MRIRAVMGVALMVLLFVSAMMEISLLEENAKRFFFSDHHRENGNQVAVSDRLDSFKASESSQVSLSAQHDQPR